MQGKSFSETLTDLKSVYGESACKTTVYRWYRQFEGGRAQVHDLQRSGRPTIVDDEIISRISSLVDFDRRMTYEQLRAMTGVSSSVVYDVLHKHLGLRKVSARWVPRKLTDQNRLDRIRACLNNEETYRKSGYRFLSRIITCDETWIHFYDPETKEQSKQWMTKEDGSPEKFRRERSTRKVMWIVFWDADGIVLSHFVPANQTVNATYYTDILRNRLIGAIADKRAGANRRIIFHQDNAPAHRASITQEFLKNSPLEMMEHPPYSPDLAPSDYHLFPSLKKHLKGKTFDNRASIASTVYQWCAARERDGFFEAGIRKLPDRWRKCIEKDGKYFEK